MSRNNRLTDVAGVAVGHAQDDIIATGVTAVLFDRPAVAAVDVGGGGPGTRETDLLNPGMTVEAIDAIALAGGSAFGLDAASGIQAWLREHNRGFPVGPARVPIVPGAILFDLNNGGDKAWGRFPPYRDLGYAAAVSAGRDFAIGSVGAGLGAQTGNLKGGLGTASDDCDGAVVAALAAVNASGSVVIGAGPHFWAAPFEHEAEFGGVGLPGTWPPEATAVQIKRTARASTTLVVVATDAALSKAEARRLAIMAQDGIAKAVYPAHTPLDGDVVFAASTGAKPLTDPIVGLARLGAIAANVVARAIACGVYAATPLPFPGALPSWKNRFGQRRSH